MGLRGNLPLFVKGFLHNRSFRVRVGGTLSQSFQQEMGVPQGSILSVTLFSIKINSLYKAVPSGLTSSLYVDDLLLLASGKTTNTVERRLQVGIYRVQDWALRNGFKFSKTKTVCMHFCHQRREHDDPRLRLGPNDAPIPVVNSAKYLGIIFDKKLNFRDHISDLKFRCNKALNLLKIVSHKEWGADRKMLLRLYQSLVRSKLDYGSIVYGSTRKTYLCQLNTIHNQGLRLSLGAFRTTPVLSLEAECGEPSLTLRREKLSLRYIARLSGNPENPNYKSLFYLKHRDLFERKPNVIKPITLRCSANLAKIGFDHKNTASFQYPETPPWTFHKFDVIFHLNQFPKESTNPDLFLSEFRKLKSDFQDSLHIYTDGSKLNNLSASAAVMGETRVGQRIRDGSSIFTAEAYALILACDIVESTNHNNFVIFSDSMSCLQSIKYLDWKNPAVQQVIERLNYIHGSTNKKVTLVWVPGHVGIPGNENVDQLAKDSLQMPTIDHFPLPSRDYKENITTTIIQIWQDKWDQNPDNKLYQIKSTVGKPSLVSSKTKHEEKVIARLRLGHSYYTHMYILKGIAPPWCLTCNEQITIRHILLECGDLSTIRRSHYNATTISEVFNDTSKTLSFLRQAKLFKKI